VLIGLLTILILLSACSAETSKSITEYPIPATVSIPYPGSLQSITADGDGNIWFVETQVNKIGKYSPSTGEFNEYPIPNLYSGADSITLGPGGNLWFTESHASECNRQNGTFYGRCHGISNTY